MNIYSDLNVSMKRQEKIKNRSLSGRKGITLVEMMVAMIILSIFVMAVGMIFISSWKLWNDGWKQIILQRDASYAFARIEKVVRDASGVPADPGGSSTLQLTKEIEGTTQWDRMFQLSGNVLQLVEGSETENIISSVQSINFSTSGNVISVTLMLIDGSSSVDFRTTIFLRNAL